jgi:hypothetical protein
MMTSQKTTLGRRLAVAAVIFATGYGTAKFLSGPAIPTCESCTLTIDPGRSTTATGKMTLMARAYTKASVIIDGPSGPITTPLATMPPLGQTFSYSTGPLPVLGAKATKTDCAKLCLYYHGAFSDLCDPVPLQCN